MKKEGRTKKFIINTFAMAMYQVVLLLYGFIFPWIIIKYYGSEINGLISSLNQFVAYFSLVEAGISGAAIYALYKPLADSDIKQINGIVTATKKYYFQAGFIFTLLIIFLAIIFPFIKRINFISPFYLSILIIFLGAKVFFDFFTLARYRVLLTADQRSYIISIASIVYQILNLIFIFVIAKTRCSIVFLYVINIVPLFIRTWILRFYVNKHYPTINYNDEPIVLNKRWDALIQQILGVVQNGAPIIILTFLVDYIQVSIFSVYNMVYQGINGLLGIFTAGLGAPFGEILARNERDVLKKSYIEFMFGYNILNVFLYSVVTVMLAPFISVYINNVSMENYYLPWFGILFGVCGFLYNLKTPQGMLIISAGHYKETKLQCLIQAALIFMFGIPLCIKIGLYGIIIALCISNLYRCIDMFWYVPSKIIYGCKRETVKSVLISIVQYVLCVFVGILITKNVSSYTVLYWIFYSIIVSAITLIILAITSLVFQRKTMLEIVHRIRNLFMNNKNI